MHGLRADAIVGYTFNADNYCTRCFAKVLPTGEGEAYDGWALADGVSMSTEDNLTEIATAFGIDREDESSFDSGDFPKVIFACQIDGPEACGLCGADLIDA
jgi:hypothetical protein